MSRRRTAARRRDATHTSLAARVGLAMGGAAAALLVSELVLRALGMGEIPTPRRIVIDGHSKEWCCGPETWVDGVHQFRAGSTFKHCYSGGSQREFDADGCVTYRINGHGYRGKDFDVSKPPDVYRIVIIGDSFTFGEGCEEPFIYPAVLAGALADGGAFGRRRPEVINLGMPGEDTSTELVTYRAFARTLRPDMVVLQWTTNDFPSSLVQQDHVRLIGRQYRAVFESAERYRFSRLLSLLYLRRRQKAISDALVSATVKDAEEGRASFDDLERMAALAQADGTRFLVLAFPELIRFEAYPYQRIVDLLIEFCRQHHIDVVDLLPSLAVNPASSLWVHETDHHPNRTAHGIAARQLRQAVTVPGR